MKHDDLGPCGGCGAPPGGVHGEECDWALCPACGEQRGSCDHAGERLPASLWHGLDPRRDVARQLGWWTTAVGIDHLVEDYTRVFFARHLGQVTWNPETQELDFWRIDEDAIDEAGRKARPPYIR